MKDTINIWTPELPEGYGAFDEDQNQTEEDDDDDDDLLHPDYSPTCGEHC